jgi:hypothetical protein
MAVVRIRTPSFESNHPDFSEKDSNQVIAKGRVVTASMSRLAKIPLTDFELRTDKSPTSAMLAAWATVNTTKRSDV